MILNTHIKLGIIKKVTMNYTKLCCGSQTITINNKSFLFGAKCELLNYK